MGVSLSVIIPAHNSALYLPRCLDALCASDPFPEELIVVDDCSTDDTVVIASKYRTIVHRLETRGGPALARNLGAIAARGDILVFIDSDVIVQTGTIRAILRSFDEAPELDALIGSYDNQPGCPEFLSQYRNLLHAYVHQSGAEKATTFWSGCGAIRRELFLEHSGFSEKFGRPAIEDIELGYRLNRAGRNIVLDRELRVKHLKTWTFWNLVKTDIVDRGIPWTELILRERYMPNDLNLHLSQRVSVALVFILVALSCVTALYSGGYVLIPLFAMLFGLLARWWIEFASARQPRNASIMLVCTVALIAAIAWRQRMFGIVPPLLMAPFLLLIKHRYARSGKRPNLIRWSPVAYTCISIVGAALYLQADKLVLVCFGILMALGLMNSEFYLFLAANRGVPFMLASIPFHLLYHFYNGLSFIAGTVRHSWANIWPAEKLPETAESSFNEK